MGRKELERHGEVLFGFGWKVTLAEALDVNRKTVSRWIANDLVAPWAAARLRGIINIAPPPGSGEDRDEACVEALEPEVTRIAVLAEGSGWLRAEILTALLALVIGDLRARAGEAATLDLLSQAIAQLRAGAAAERN